MSVCLSFSSRENAYEESNAMEAISKKRALEILREAEEAGLIHSSMNIAQGHSYICNCCTCCCGVLKGLVKYNQPNAFVKSDFVIEIDNELCNGCGRCVSRCQFNALSIRDYRCHVDDNCVGCGVCAIVCAKEALSLVPRKNSDKNKPPRNIGAWMLRKAFRRRKNILKIL